MAVGKRGGTDKPASREQAGFLFPDGQIRQATGQIPAQTTDARSRRLHRHGRSRFGGCDSGRWFEHLVPRLADDFSCVLGSYVTVGHAAILHACTIGDQVLVGMGSTVLDGAVVGEQSLIGANALITPGTQIPPGSLVLGTPAKVVRKLTRQERSELKGWAQKYVRYAAYCLEHGINVSGPLRS